MGKQTIYSLLKIMLAVANLGQLVHAGEKTFSPIFFTLGDRVLAPPAWVVENQNRYDTSAPTQFRKRFLLVEPSLRRSDQLDLTFRFRPEPVSYAHIYLEALTPEAFLEILLVEGKRALAAVRLSAYPPQPSGFFEIVEEFKYHAISTAVASTPLEYDRNYRVRVFRTAHQLTVELDGRAWLSADSSKFGAAGWGLSSGNWPLDLIELKAKSRRGAWISALAASKPKDSKDSEPARQLPNQNRHGALLALAFVAPLMLLGTKNIPLLLRATCLSLLTLLPALLHRVAPFRNAALQNSLVVALGAFLLCCGLAVLNKYRVRYGATGRSRVARTGALIIAAGSAPVLILAFARPDSPTEWRFFWGLSVFVAFGFMLAWTIRHEDVVRHYDFVCLILAALSVLALELTLRQLPKSMWGLAFGKPLVLAGRTGVDYWPGGAIRNRRYEIPKPRNVTRVLCVGGSSVYGWPFSEGHWSWPVKTEGLLNRSVARSGHRWQLMNAGINGFTSFLISEAYPRLLARYEPDMIVVCARFNDSTRGGFRWFLEFPQMTDAQAWRYTDAWARRPGIVPIYRALDSLESFRLLRAWIAALKPKGALPAHNSNPTVPRGTLSEFHRHLAEIVRFARTQGTKPVFMIEADSDGGTLQDAIRSKSYVRAMAREAERLKIPILDTYSALAGNEDQWVWYDYIHTTPLGNELIAAKLASFLKHLSEPTGAEAPQN